VNAIAPNSLDHVALWTDERDALADFLCDHLGMHVIERDDDFTLVGSDARRGKLTLFAAEGPREPGALERVVLRTRDVEAAVTSLPETVEVSRDNGVATFEALGLGLGLTLGEGHDYDLDHVILRASDPDRTAAALAELGFERRDGALSVADRSVRLVPGQPATDSPLLNHLALLVDSVEQVREEAERRGRQIIKVVDAPNTLAVFVRGPEDIQIEYVEHKPGFALV
jgi:catechol 2,3-dioxygenase-like lactoylglutathione lyase family enzyme